MMSQKGSKITDLTELDGFLSNYKKNREVKQNQLFLKRGTTPNSYYYTFENPKTKLCENGYYEPTNKAKKTEEHNNYITLFETRNLIQSLYVVSSEYKIENYNNSKSPLIFSAYN
ncbi:MAG: hypothetical protein ABIJ97_07590, partial [Bacteroidota bacterium]